MNDVFGEVLLATGDENLLSSDRIAAIRIGHGTRTTETEISPRVRLGQAHGARPFAGGETWQISTF